MLVYSTNAVLRCTGMRREYQGLELLVVGRRPLAPRLFCCPLSANVAAYTGVSFDTTVARFVFKWSCVTILLFCQRQSFESQCLDTPVVGSTRTSQSFLPWQKEVLLISTTRLWQVPMLNVNCYDAMHVKGQSIPLKQVGAQRQRSLIRLHAWISTSIKADLRF